MAYYLECCAKAGRAPGVTAIRRDIYVGADAADAKTIGGAVVAAGYRGFPADATIVGDAQSVAAAFQEYAAMGYSDLIVRNLVADQAQASIARLRRVKELL